MLKSLPIILFFCIPFIGVSQSFDKHYEMAYFAVSQQGESAYTTTVKSMKDNFTDEDLLTLTEIMSEKEGIFELVQIEEGYITISHLSYISKETLKDFITIVKGDIEFVSIKDYNF